MSEAPEKQVTVADARDIAFRYLVRREHSCKELRDKLYRKGIPTEVISQAVEELEGEDLVSDLRFAQAFTRSRISTLYGPLKIRAELMKRGITSVLIDQVLAEHRQIWQESARLWVLKKRRGALDRTEKARLYRSGTSRGFSHEHLMQAFDSIRREL